MKTRYMKTRYMKTILLTAVFTLLAVNSLLQSWMLSQRCEVKVHSLEGYYPREELKTSPSGYKKKDIGCRLPYNSWTKGIVSVFRTSAYINCEKILHKDKKETDRIRHAMSTWKTSSSNKEILNSQNCFWLKEYVGDIFYTSDLEFDFPLAYTLVVHDSPEQVLRLLRILYRRQNSFCIHVDSKSPHKEFFQSVAGCFQNIVVPPNLTTVVWGHSSILEAQMKCMNELVKLRKRQEYKWKYLLNLCGKELPLATNREMVQQLMKCKGTSNIKPKRVTADQTEYNSRVMHPVRLNKNKTKIIRDKLKTMSDPPFNLSRYYYKSSGYHALSFPFVHHLLHNDTAISIRNFFFSCKNPEEHFYATVFMMPGVPGGYDARLKHYFSMVNVLWVPPHPCAGKIVHRVCIIGAGDLAKVIAYGKGHFFHNKYFLEYDHSVMYCMERRLVSKNKKEYYADCS